jgi:hypothetical protein
MVPKSAKFILTFAVLAATTASGRAWGQDAGKSKDEALDSLMKELRESEKAPAKPAKPATAETKKATGPQDKSKVSPRANATGDKAGKAAATKSDKPSAIKNPDAAKLAPKDQAIDDLLGKLGESKDDPTAPEEPRSRAPGQGPTEPSRGGQKPGADKLGAKDKDLDERLEELTGRKKKRSSSDQERTGPIGEMIKEMREVEQRLGKPDPSEDTQKKQKQIVKRIETLIEQVKQQGGSAGSMAMRRMRQQGQQPGQQDGDQPGAQGRGAPPMKPAKPTGAHSTAGGKDVWGHLPAELRDIMENSFKETELDSKRELISRYFLSVDKGRLVREE